jgi:hypothetical protein
LRIITIIVHWVRRAAHVTNRGMCLPGELQGDDERCQKDRRAKNKSFVLEEFHCHLLFMVFVTYFSRRSHKSMLLRLLFSRQILCGCSGKDYVKLIFQKNFK